VRRNGSRSRDRHKKLPNTKQKKIQEAEDAERARFVLESLLKSQRFKEMKVESPTTWEKKVGEIKAKLEKERKAEDEKRRLLDDLERMIKEKEAMDGGSKPDQGADAKKPEEKGK